MPTHSFTFSVQAGFSVTKRFDVTAGAEKNVDETIPAPSTNLALDWDVKIAKLKSLYMVSDKDLVVKTNSGGSPVNTFTLAAGVPFIWTVNSPALRDTAGTAVTVDITELYLTLGGTDAAQFQILAIVDPT